MLTSIFASVSSILWNASLHWGLDFLLPFGSPLGSSALSTHGLGQWFSVFEKSRNYPPRGSFLRIQMPEPDSDLLNLNLWRQETWASPCEEAWQWLFHTAKTVTLHCLAIVHHVCYNKYNSKTFSMLTELEVNNSMSFSRKRFISVLIAFHYL